jgi:quercetin dioxygenase-like cupin family protein
MSVVSTVEEMRLGQITIRFLLEGEAAGGSVAMFECDVPAGARVPVPHSHDGTEETIYGLRGVMTWTVEGTPHHVGPGQVLCIRRGAVHRFENLSGTDASMLCVVTPGVLSPNYFRELAALARESGGRPPDPAAIAQIMRRHGLTPQP